MQLAAPSSSLGSAQSLRRATASSNVLRGGVLPMPMRSPRASRALAVRPRALMGGDDNKIDVGDRVVATLPYLLPLLDAIPYGKFMLMQYPFVARALSPLAPLAMVYNSFPLFPFIVFLGVYTGIVNNQSLSRFVRYNALQAVLLDILLIIPQLILNDIIKPPNNDVGMQLYIGAENTIFLFVFISVAYGMGSTMVGATARLPLVAEAADSQIR
ncbi:hypothetical protein FOA52_015410 [Chlamydomonas sp. UWO 241]|nr:hypothetical protein FOA52_015410 [Chlamydomonas sp. UWO 241]